MTFILLNASNQQVVGGRRVTIPGILLALVVGLIAAFTGFVLMANIWELLGVTH